MNTERERVTWPHDIHRVLNVDFIVKDLDSRASYAVSVHRASER